MMCLYKIASDLYLPLHAVSNAALYTATAHPQSFKKLPQSLSGMEPGIQPGILQHEKWPVTRLILGDQHG